jgi:Pro-kumamolisin, activation domain/Bacterial Ig-like domain (group 3)
MLSYPKLALAALISTSLWVTCSQSANAQTPQRASRIGPIDESSRIALQGNRHPLATAANDRGEVASDLPMERMLLVLKREPAAESALQELISSQQDKSSPAFHAWLSPEQFADRFGPSKSDLQTLATWLQSHGFRVNRIARGGMSIEFSGTAAQVNEAFQTPIHSFVVDGKNHYANASDPQIPAAFASLVAGVSTLHNFQKQPTVRPLGPASRIANTSTWQPSFTFNGAAGAFHYLSPGDFAKIFNTAALYQTGIDGTGQSIAIVGRNNINLSDIQIFRIAFGLPPNDPTIILDGPDPGNFLGSGEETEADLDVEWSGAIAPKATIKFVVSASTNTTDGADLSAQYIVDNNIAPVLSMSFGECEFNLGQAQNAFFNNLWAQAAAEGITAIISSGDNGAAGCDDPNFGPAAHPAAVNGLASTPFNVAVGGTQFSENGNDSKYWAATNGPDQSSVLGYIPEAVWNESCADANQCGFINLFASSGGPSTIYPKPAWQAGLGVPQDGRRDLTDSTGQLINAFVVGGTSASTPTFAAIMALVNQKTNSRQGQANFVLYPLAAAQNATSQSAANCNSSGPPQSTCIFNDITQGNNNVPGLIGFSAQPGYDLATGLGSVNAANLVNGWLNSFAATKTTLALSPSPVSITHGQSVTASVTVAPVSASGTPTGDVALLTSTGQSINLGMLINGALSLPVSTLPGGTYTVTASYSGDGTFGTSVSSPAISVTVGSEPSTTTFSTLNGSLIPSTSTTYSDFFFLQAAVAGASNQGAATGTVTFSDTFNGATANLTSAPLSIQGSVLVQETSLAIGTHTLSASYSGDASFQPSSSNSVTIIVTKGITQTFLFAPNGAPPASPITLEAIVFQNGVAAPTGTVQFFSGTQAIGAPVKLQNSVALLTTSQLPVGSNSITAAYSGDANFNASTSQPSIVFIGNPDFQIAVNPGNITASASAPGTTTLLVSPGPGLGFAGTVTFACSGLPTGATCSMLPAQLTLDGFNPASAKVTITKSAQAATRFDPFRHQLRFGGPVAALGMVFVQLLLFWNRKNYRLQFAAFILLICSLGMVAGCGGSSSATTSPSGTSSPNFAVVTLTATGAGGFSNSPTPVTHSVTLAVTLQ